MKIAIAHFRVGETDGVSLEMEKWKIALEKMGHEVMFLAGSKGESDAYIIEELHYENPVNDSIVKNAYNKLVDFPDAQALEHKIMSFSKSIEEKLLHFIKEENIDLVIPNNIWSLGWGLPAGIAFTNVAKKTDIQFLAHHHDFHWEREKYSNPTCDFVSDYLKEYFPPKLDNVNHVVINEIAKKELFNRRGIVAEVVPNVFDFEGDLWKVDDYNRDFRRAINVTEEAILVLQATRITERKAIELGVEVVGELQKQHTSDKKIVYVLAGLPEAEGTYIQQLKELAEKNHVDIRFINDVVDHSRKIVGDKKIYSLWDVYVFSDLITYPSILEGWGNQLLEAVFAKKPMVLYEYPVFLSDIKDKGFDFISLGSEHTVNSQSLVEVDKNSIVSAAKEASNVLSDHALVEKVTVNNFNVGKNYYSYESLYHYLSNLFTFKEKN